MNLEQIKQSAFKEIEESRDLKSLEGLRIKYLGRKSQLVEILHSLKDVPLNQRQKIGPVANVLKKELDELIKNRKAELREDEGSKKIDLSRPAQKISRGHFHPLTIAEEKICRIFLTMNFSVVEGPEIENEFYNFDALNIPPNHPARDLWNTLWLKTRTDADKTQIDADKTQIDADKTRTKADSVRENLGRNQRQSALLLRTHTSPMQIRYMETHQPPFQIIVPGRVFRYEATDASHEINFYQVEGLMVGSRVSLANFKFIIETFLKKFFGPNIKFRFRPSYFPFVEPGLEVDVWFKDKWLEVMGAGMVARKVFDAVRYNPDQVQGFAFGLGLDRLVKIKYNLPDIRLLYSGDLRFIKQF